VVLLCDPAKQVRAWWSKSSVQELVVVKLLAKDSTRNAYKVKKGQLGDALKGSMVVG